MRKPKFTVKVRALTAAEAASLTYHVYDPTAVTCPEPDE